MKKNLLEELVKSIGEAVRSIEVNSRRRASLAQLNPTARRKRFPLPGVAVPNERSVFGERARVRGKVYSPLAHPEC
jgi:hypothetical protein